MIPNILCFSGSDPSGGAGIQADIGAIHALGGHCASIITALTVQNTQNVFGFQATSTDLMLHQADIILQDLTIHAVKIGMLGSISNVLALGLWLQKHAKKIPIVLDPVTVATGGGELGEASIVEAISQYLIPLATVVTPNSIEAKQFAPHAQHLTTCAEYFLNHGAQNVLIKGSHEAAPTVINRLYNHQGLISELSWTRLPHEFHGSGCTLAASLATFLALGYSVQEAAAKSQDYTWHCLLQAYQPGKAHFIPNRWINYE